MCEQGFHLRPLVFSWDLGPVNLGTGSSGCGVNSSGMCEETDVLSLPSKGTRKPFERFWLSMVGVLAKARGQGNPLKGLG